MILKDVTAANLATKVLNDDYSSHWMFSTLESLKPTVCFFDIGIEIDIPHLNVVLFSTWFDGA